MGAPSRVPFCAANALLLAGGCAALHLFIASLGPDGSPYGRLRGAADLQSCGRQVLAALLALLFWKGLRQRSLDHILQQFFFYSKLALLLTALLVDVRLGAWLVLAAWGCYVAFPQPLHPLSSNAAADAIYLLSPLKLKEQVLKGEDTWVVLFYTTDHAPSIAMAPAFAELAKQFASDGLRFGCMDACLWPRFSRETLKVTPNIWSHALPTVVLYARGAEVGRLPAPHALDDLGLRPNHFTKTDLIKRFGLSEGGAEAAAARAGKAAAGKRGGARGGAATAVRRQAPVLRSALDEPGRPRAPRPFRAARPEPLSRRPAAPPHAPAAMAKSKNHTAHNQSKKAHRNGIKRPQAHKYTSRKGMDPKFLRNQRHAKKHNVVKADK
ncbi:RPL29A [Scenedesmus sp. PABB004]|nr:RPL29A [Scenedesmus sp. PABB004]